MTPSEGPNTALAAACLILTGIIAAILAALIARA